MEINSLSGVEATLGVKSILLALQGKRVRQEIAIGKKSLNQLKLWQLGSNIPDTVVLEFSFYDLFRKRGQIDLQTVHQNWIAELLGPSIAIRCSSNIEDDERKSFAGVFDTYLDVPNKGVNFENHIAESFVKFALLDESISYLNKYDIKVGIMVQRMIDPQFSGFLFTSDPMNPPNPWIKIEYWHGAREKSSGGTLTLNRTSGKRVDSELDLNTMPLPLAIQSQLYESSKQLEHHFGFPQDVEFLVSGKDARLYVVQSRPITAFSFSPERIRISEQTKLTEIREKNRHLFQLEPVLSHTNISELFVRAIPLGYSIFKYGFAGTSENEGGISVGRSRLGYAKMDLKDQDHLFYTVADQARINIITDALTYRLPEISRNEYLDKFVKYYLDEIEQDPQKAIYPENGLYIQEDQDERWTTVAGEAKEIHRSYSKFLQHVLEYHAPRELKQADAFFKQNDQFYTAAMSQDLQTVSPSLIRKEFVKILEYLRTVYCPQYTVYARLAFLSTSISKQKLHRLELTRENLTAEKILNELLQNMDINSEYNGPNIAQSERLLKAGKITLWDFLNKFQHVGSLDIHQPRLGEYSIKDLHSIFSDSRQYVYMEDFQASQYNRIQVGEILKAYALDKNTDFWKWCQFAGKFMKLREKAKCELLKVLYILKRTIKQIAEIYNLGELIHYLEYHEVLALNQKNRDRFRLIALERSAYFSACSQKRVRKVITSLQDFPFEEKMRAEPSEGGSRYHSIKGKTVFYGYVEGVCLTASSSEEYLRKLTAFRKQKIETIVGVFKGVELSYFNLSTLGGFITENGGFLSHAATIAREFGLPYITGISMDQFKDGDYLILDTENEQVIHRR
jgi:phosphohistidine swiveling domain-containing protein